MVYLGRRGHALRVLGFVSARIVIIRLSPDGPGLPHLVTLRSAGLHRLAHQGRARILDSPIENRACRSTRDRGRMIALGQRRP
jgi:hypothetical protein